MRLGAPLWQLLDRDIRRRKAPYYVLRRHLISCGYGKDQMTKTCRAAVLPTAHRPILRDTSHRPCREAKQPRPGLGVRHRQLEIAVMSYYESNDEVERRAVAAL